MYAHTICTAYIRNTDYLYQFILTARREDDSEFAGYITDGKEEERVKVSKEALETWEAARKEQGLVGTTMAYRPSESWFSLIIGG